MPEPQQNITLIINNVFRNTKYKQVRLFFSFYDEEGSLARYIQKYGEKDIPKLDFYNAGYKESDFFQNVKYIFKEKEFKNKEIKNQNISIQGYQYQVVLYVKKLISLHFKFILEESNNNNNNKNALCSAFYNNSKFLTDFLQEIFNELELSHYPVIRNLKANIEKNYTKPCLSFIAEFSPPFGNNGNNDINKVINEVINADINVQIQSKENYKNYKQIRKIENILAQNLFTCLKGENLKLIYTKEYMDKLLELVINENIILKSFLGIRKNGVWIIKNNNNNSDTLNSLVDDALSALNNISLIIFLLQTLDSQIVSILKERIEKDKSITSVLDDLEEVYLHIISLNPYVIKHSASLTAWSLPEETIINNYKLLENMFDTITFLFNNLKLKYTTLENILFRKMNSRD